MSKNKKNSGQAQELHKNINLEKKSNNHKQEKEWLNVMDSNHNNISEGAANSFELHKMRTNREGKQSYSKDHHKEGHPVHKGPKKKK